MANKFITENLRQVIATKSRPAITVWNRLEGRPRADNFARALRAEVRDALWMTTRQWQLGELRGDDAGSPIFAKVRIETTKLRKYQAASGSAEPFDDTTPLEAHVERMPIRFEQGGCGMSLDIRLLMGRHWLKMVRPLAPSAVEAFIAAYPVHAPNPTSAGDAAICAHPEAWSMFAAVAGRRMDGWTFYTHIKRNGADHAADGIAALSGKVPEAKALAERFMAWFEKLFCQPDAESAWVPDRLEYQFAASAPQEDGEKVFTAEEYYNGHLDWHNFDVDPKRSSIDDGPVDGDARQSQTLTMLPTQVMFNGMPNTRWWAFEDSRTSFGDIRPDTTDLAKLLLIEFGLVYANDWFLVPFVIPAGSIASVAGIAVTNVFGERIWIEAAGRGDDDDWQRWAMFLVSIKGQGHEPADLSLVIPPSAQHVLEGTPLEEVMLARDEMANMVWGIETSIALPSGDGKDGRHAADETRQFFERDFIRRLGVPPSPPPAAEGAKVRYLVMSSVPENWIPLIPAHVPGDNREIQLQRGAMLRVLEGDTFPPVLVRPRTSLLRPGLDGPAPAAYFLHEEEVSRAGVRVTQRFRRTRWRDGRALVWLGVRKHTGRGEGSSGLAYDRIEDVRTDGAGQL